MKPFLLAIAVTAVLFGAAACSAEDAAPALPAAQAAPAQAAAPAAPAAAVAAPGAPQAPRAAAAAAPAADAMAPAAVPKGAVPQATAATAATQALIAGEQRGKRTEVPKHEAPRVSLAATAVGEQHLAGANGGLYGWKPWREGGRNGNWMPWVYMPAFMYDKNNDLRQGFATAFSLSEDGKTYTFHLHPDAVFTDGSPLTAAAYKWALEYAMYPANQTSWGGSSLDLKSIEGSDEVLSGDTEDVKGMVALDDHTLEFLLKQNTPTFPYRMGVWLQGIFKAEAAEEQGEDFFLNPIGVGPYTATIVPEGSASLVVTENYWQAPPIIQSYTVQYVPNNDAELAMFENGELDIIYAWPGNQTQTLEPSHPLNQYLVRMPYAGLISYVRFNTAREPFQDINIRKALALSLDHDAITKAVYGQVDHRALSVLVPEMRCYDPAFKGYEYDPEQAKMYLAQSEYKTGGNVPSPSITDRTGTLRTSMYQAWQAGWKEVLGIDFKINLVVEGGETPPDVNMMSDGWGAYVPDPGFLLDLIVHTKTAGVMHVNDELDAKLERANAMRLDDRDRCAAYREVDQEFMNNYYILPTVRLNYNYLVQPWVIGMELSVQGMIPSLPFMKIGKKN